MTYHVEHLYVDTTGVVHDGVKRARYSDSGELIIRHPGHLNLFVQALYYTKLNGGHPVQHAVTISTKRVFSPDGIHLPVILSTPV
jgi:hypothetical protein